MYTNFNMRKSFLLSFLFLSPPLTLSYFGGRKGNNSLTKCNDTLRGPCAGFMFDVFGTLQGAFYGILTGHICGVARMAIDFAFPAPGCGEFRAEEMCSTLYRLEYQISVQ